jgi:catechol 2,3-dioxygenase-like lactoylglutathione lyase family enzyme
MTPLQLLHMTHLNALVDGYEDTIEHFTKIFGGQVNMRIPGAPDDPDDTDACVFTIGYVIFEFFAPRRRGDKGQGRLLGRFDDHYLGIEFQVPDVSEARSRCEELDIRIINDRGHMFFTYPGSCLGLSWELWEGNFYESLGPDSPQGPLHPRSYWRDEHPLGLDGLKRVSVAVNDLDAATERFSLVTGATPMNREPRPRAAAVGSEFQVGDTVVELMAPTGPGPVASFLDRYGEHMRSTVFRATDLARVEKHLSDQGLSVVPGDRDDTLAIPPEQNHNLLFEFSE